MMTRNKAHMALGGRDRRRAPNCPLERAHRVLVRPELVDWEPQALPRVWEDGMPEESEFRASPLALAVLSLLHAEPLHPYAMQRLLKLWGKDHVVNVGQRANLYKTIRRLDDAGLIAVRQTERHSQYPERTVYELTEGGRRAAHDWLTDMLARPRNEFPQFPAALSFIMLLTPEEALRVLDERAAALRDQLAAIEADLRTYSGALPRIVLMDDEYQRAVLGAELDWVEGVAADLRSGDLGWSYEEFEDAAAAFLPDSPAGE
jgi:DNA-binding PadR family transcriptional regulator